jgi:hypothetical protein
MAEKGAKTTSLRIALARGADMHGTGDNKVTMWWWSGSGGLLSGYGESRRLTLGIDGWMVMVRCDAQRALEMGMAWDYWGLLLRKYGMEDGRASGDWRLEIAKQGSGHGCTIVSRQGTRRQAALDKGSECKQMVDDTSERRP